MRTAHARRLVGGATAVVAATLVAGATPVQATDLVVPIGSEGSCVPRIDVVIPGPGGPAIGPLPGGPIPPLVGIAPTPGPMPAGDGLVTARRGGDVGAPLTYVIKPLDDKEFDDWGATDFYRPKVDVGAVCVAGVWHARVTSATQPIKQGTRLLEGYSELTVDAIDAVANVPGPPTLQQLRAACTTLSTIATEVKQEADAAGGPGAPDPERPGPKYFMEAAVQAHEKVHVDQHKTWVAAPYRTLKATIAKIPPVRATSERAALARMKTAIDKARSTFVTKATEMARKTAAHQPSRTPFSEAENAVVKPMLDTVKARMGTLGCP